MVYLGEDVLRYIAENTNRIIKALLNYYSYFLTKKERTLSNWCRLEEVLYDKVLDYMVIYDFGMPKTKEDASQYLERLKEIEQKQN